MNKTANVQNAEASKSSDDQSRANNQRIPQWALIVLSILAMVAFWGTFAYAVWVRNMELVMIFTAIIAIGVGVYGTIHFLSTLFRDSSKKMKE